MTSWIDMDEQKLEQLRSIKITTLLGIKDTGRKIFIKCPVHGEKTASMLIYPDGHYHCYGCESHGTNVIDFLMSMGSTFREACEYLDNIK